MSTDYYSQNLTILQQHNPLLAEELNKTGSGIPGNAPINGELDNGELKNDVIKIEAAASGDPTLAIKGLYVHSK